MCAGEKKIKKESGNTAVYGGREVHNEFSGFRDVMSYIKVSER